MFTEREQGQNMNAALATNYSIMWGTLSLRRVASSEDNFGRDRFICYDRVDDFFCLWVRVIYQPFWRSCEVRVEQDEHYKKKNGKPGKSYIRQYERIPVSPLNTCERCGVLGSLRKVCARYRGQVSDESKYLGEWACDPMLCVSCWNKARPVWKKEVESIELKKAINKAERELAKWRKSQRQDNCASSLQAPSTGLQTAL